MEHFDLIKLIIKNKDDFELIDANLLIEISNLNTYDFTFLLKDCISKNYIQEVSSNGIPCYRVTNIGNHFFKVEKKIRHKQFWLELRNWSVFVLSIFTTFLSLFNFFNNR